ncbi:lipase 3-like [Venturia canescens]|uniref:lipase 3-like n=1 Tax=Venturia canescens TaxID=32260 RepID=UPI001C9C3201|nr:lipase 3-like [Venturia canescens]
MAKRSGLAAARQTPVTSITESYHQFESSDKSSRGSSVLSNYIYGEYSPSVNSRRKFTARYPRPLIVIMSFSAIAVLATLALFVKDSLSSEAINYVTEYFEKPETNKFQLNVLPEYEVELHECPATLSASTDPALDRDNADPSIGATMYRIPGGPKSPKTPGKRVSFIEHGILCDSQPCTVNKLKIAIVYLLVDQGYDVWLGLSNSSMMEDLIMSRTAERERLERVAHCIFVATNQTELLVMGNLNGTVQFFAISTPIAKWEQSKVSKWLEYIPGVKTVKKLYYKGKNYLTRSYEKIVESIDLLGKRVDLIIDDPSVRNLKNTVLRAWGIIVTMVAPTLSLNDFSKMINHPDVYLDALQLITKYGYTAELHHVRTEDGYLLSVHRITGGKRYPPGRGKPVVFLQHGILSSSAVWILMGPSKSLAYFLADEGYDVWMGNSRGNTYSRGHLNLSSSDSKFWDFSFHEMGYYDLPATVDYIVANTGQEKINYIGHSQGTTSFFVMLSEKPQYNDKINRFIAYAPIVYANNVRSPIVDFFSKISSPLYRTLQFLNVHDFLPTNALLTKIGRDVCEKRTLYQVVCSNALFMVTGYDSAQINKTIVPIIMGHLPAGSSVKQFVHFAQEFTSKKFRQFDYYEEEKNLAKYGAVEPPGYKIENVKVPGMIFYAKNDWLADSRDVEKLGNELKNAELHEVPMELFNHIDFMFAMDAPLLIYHPTIDYLRRELTNEIR